MGVTPQQAAYLLAMAGTFDARIKPASPEDAQARAVMWSEALRADMDPEWARKAVVAHYATSDKVLMPAHLNDQWAAYVRVRAAQEREDAARQERQQAEVTAVPMPDFIRARQAPKGIAG